MGATPRLLSPAPPGPALPESALSESAASGPASTTAGPISIPERPLASRQDQALQKALEHPGDPLPLSVRARLAPVMGRELGAVRLLRNAEAAAATAAAAADALTVGDKVLLSSGQDLASPRGLGLLAHELTHVLRGRDPDFVPLIVREQPRARAPEPATPPPSGLPAQVGASAQASRMQNSAAPFNRAPGLDEEGLAEYVEAQVRQRVQATSRSVGTLSPTGPAASATPVAASEAPWGALPAPWEPLPFWDPPATGGPSGGQDAGHSASGHSVSGRSASGRSASLPSALPSVQPNTQPSARPAAAPVAQAASSTRSVDASPPAPAPSSLGEAVGSDRNKSGRPAPDLDRLAQQVYGLIKRRLATETRRSR